MVHIWLCPLEDALDDDYRGISEAYLMKIKGIIPERTGLCGDQVEIDQLDWSLVLRLQTRDFSACTLPKGIIIQFDVPVRIVLWQGEACQRIFVIKLAVEVVGILR